MKVMEEESQYVLPLIVETFPTNLEHNMEHSMCYAYFISFDNFRTFG